jgi:hypothetical protein
VEDVKLVTLKIIIKTNKQKIKIKIKQMSTGNYFEEEDFYLDEL